MSPPKQNILLFPFMAQGHIIPFLSLSLKLQNHSNYTITLINTPSNITNLKRTLPPKSSLRLLDFPFDPTAHGLPPATETTENLSPQLISRFIESSSALEPVVRKIISIENTDNPLVCIISDSFFPWTVGIARELGISHAFFIPGGAFGTVAWRSAYLPLPTFVGKNPNGFLLPDFSRTCAIKINHFPDLAEKPSEYLEKIFHGWEETDAMLVNTAEELDGVALSYLHKILPNCLVLAVGPIINGPRQGKEEENRECMKWLDSKPEKSVLYVAFGSQSSPSGTQMLELAKALEASNVNFLWAFRPPSISCTNSSSKTNDNNGDGDSNEVKENGYLPNGFEDRIRASGKGLLLKTWAPQKEILGHGSVGAFLTHCGWNSTMESLSHGIPMLAWPMMADQPFNALLLEDFGVGERVASGTTCEVRCEEIMRKIELIMKLEDGTKGSLMRRKACEVMGMIQNATFDEDGRKGSSAKAVESFVTHVSLGQEIGRYERSKLVIL